MSPLAKAVEKAGLTALLRKRNPLLISAGDFFTESELIRKEFSKIVTCPAANVAIIPSASYGISTIANNIPLKRGDEVVVLGGQFPSNVYPWQRLVNESSAKLITVEPPNNLNNRGAKWNQRILESINTKTKVVAMGHVHWADGTLFDLQAIRKRASDVNAMLIIDGTQSVGALPLDVSILKPDALVCAGYKWLMGPYTTGLAYYSDRFFNGRPLEENWITRKASEDFTALVNYRDEYQPGARRFDMGERSNFILNPMLLAALKMVNDWKPARVQQYAQKITAKPLQTLRGYGWWIEDNHFRASHLFGLRPEAPVDIDKLKKRLLKARIAVSYRGDVIRVAPHVYNSENDLWRLVEVISKI